MDKLTLSQVIEKAVKEIVKENEERFEKAIEEARTVFEENDKEEETKLVITIDDENTLIEGYGNQATLFNGVHALCKLLKDKHQMELHEIFMAMEFAEKFNGMTKR